MNQLVVTLIVILMPGIIATVISDKITIHSKWTSFKFSLYALVLGVFSYIVLQFIYYGIDVFSAEKIAGLHWSHLQIWKAFYGENPAVPAAEVAFAMLLSFPVAFIASYSINHKIFNKIAQALRVSAKYGDENLYSYYLNAKEIDWLYVRDIENNLTYQGRIVMYSETETMQELVLSEVTVFRYEDSEELYSVPTIYITKEIGRFIIEAVPQELLGAINGKETTT